MGFRLAVVAAVVVVFASTAGAAIAVGVGGIGAAQADPGEDDVTEQVAHFLSPSDLNRDLIEDPVADDPSDSSLPESVHTDDPRIANRVGPKGSNDSNVLPLVPPSKGLTDTSGDGYPDIFLETAPPLAKHDPDPERKNVFLEVDYMEGCNPRPVVNQTAEVFADAPVQNPDGSTGIDLHVEYDREVPRAALVTPEQSQLDAPTAGEYREQAFRHEGRGYHYVLFVHNAGSIDGFRHDKEGIMVVECDGSDTLMHELGHALGLDHEDGPIDSTQVPFEAYPSTMNYDRPEEYFRFSTGSRSPADHDDWAEIESSMARSTPSMEVLASEYFDRDDVLTIDSTVPPNGTNRTNATLANESAHNATAAATNASEESNSGNQSSATGDPGADDETNGEHEDGTEDETGESDGANSNHEAGESDGVNNKDDLTNEDNNVEDDLTDRADPVRTPANGPEEGQGSVDAAPR